MRLRERDSASVSLSAFAVASQMLVCSETSSKGRSERGQSQQRL